MMDAASSVPLHMTLADIARLAKVQRPVVSMWRRRNGTSATPFPEPLVTVRGEERFDAGEVVDWLERTGRGNNPKVREDCAAFASPKGMSAEDDQIVFDGLAALLCLKEISGKSLAGVTDHALLDLADEADPDDEFLLSEISALGQRLHPHQLLRGHPGQRLLPLRSGIRAAHADAPARPLDGGPARVRA